MSNQAPDTLKEDVPGCFVEQDSWDRLVEQAYDPERLANPGDPEPRLIGTGTMDAMIITDRWSEQNAYEYRFRSLVSQDAGTGWGYILIPTIAGFQQPIITVEGTYRLQSTAVQEDGSGNTNNNSTEGASPRGPYMGQEAHHWSSTNRIYLGFFRRDNPHRTYVEYRMRYICS